LVAPLAKGAAVARLVGTTCQGCHLSIRRRGGADQAHRWSPLAHCDNCGASWFPDARRSGRLLRRCARGNQDGRDRAVVFDPSSAPPARLAAVSERIGETTKQRREYRALIAGLEAAAATPSRA